ncbi:phospholipase, partial [Klebsiella pneumoniae]
AEVIKKAAHVQIDKGRTPEKDGSLHLFVITNVTEGGIGAGTVNTQRMLESLGRANTIPGVTRSRMIEKIREEDPGKFASLAWSRNPATQAQINEEFIRRQKEYEAKLKQAEELKDSDIPMVPIPGLKIHICSLVAQDSPVDNWMPVYIHSKLMIINDVFTTHGSANINTRSMQVDSEMNIAHEWGSVTRDLRRRLWGLHTSGKGVQDNASDAFDAWEYILSENKKRQQNHQKPIAPLIAFYYAKNELKDLD